jgi:hypothetical protein
MSNNEFFEEFGYVYLSNVLTPAQCEVFSDLMLSKKKNEELRYEKTVDSFMYQESYGGNDQLFERTLRNLTPRFEDELKVKLIPANSYCRIYYNGATLKPHRDRVGLDYTLSISLFSNIKTEWPLMCIDRKGNTVPININIGDGGMMYGTEINHWRENLVCDLNEYTIQLFMHWSFAS